MRLDKANLRANLYGLALAAVALASGVGWLTGAQAAVVAALAGQTITLAFAALWAARTGAPLTRQVIYGFLAALAAAFTTWGLVGADTAELVVGVVMAAVGIFIAESNTGTTEPSEGHTP